jgi:hypothetical protein
MNGPVFFVFFTRLQMKKSSRSWGLRRFLRPRTLEVSPTTRWDVPVSNQKIHDGYRLFLFPTASQNFSITSQGQKNDTGYTPVFH